MLTIHTFGHIDAVFFTLQAIAMIMNDSFVGSLIKFLCIVSIFYGCIKLAFEYSQGSPQAKRHLVRIFIIIILINGALVPKMPLKIVDHVTKETDQVGNLPLGFALPVGLIETIGISITALFDQAFKGIDHFRYTSYGPSFAASLIAESRSWRMQDPELVLNMSEFLDRCVLMPASWGSPLTIDELVHSPNVWEGLLKNKLKNGIRKVILTFGGQKQSLSCQPAWEKLGIALDKDFLKLSNSTKFSIFGTARESGYLPRSEASKLGNKNFLNNIKNVFSAYNLHNTSGVETLQQIMIMNQFRDIALDYGVIRAEQNQENAWQISGKIAGSYLPMLLTVLKCLLYACFIFILPLTILSGNISQFTNFFVLIFSFQLWPPLYTVLNMFTDLYTSSCINNLAAGAVTLATYSKIGHVADKIVAIAAGLQMSVPFLATAIVKGGLESLVHMSGSLTGASMSAASNAAQEVTSGNRSFDNVSMNNVSSNKLDTNLSYKSGGSEIQKADNSLVKASASGQEYSVAGPGISQTQAGFKYIAHSDKSSEISKAINNQQSAVESLSASYSKSRQLTQDDSINLLDNLSRHESLSKSLSKDIGVDSAKQLSKTVSEYKNLTQNEGFSKDEALQKIYGFEGSVSVSGSLPIKQGISALLGVGGNASFKGSYTNSTNDGKNSSSSNQEGHSAQDNINNTLSILSKVASSENAVETLGIDKGVAKSFQQHYAQMQQVAENHSKAYDQLRSLQEQQSSRSSSGISTSVDVTHDVINDTAKALGMKSYDVTRAIESGDRRVKNVADAIAEKKFGAHGDNIPSTAQFKAMYQQPYSSVDPKLSAQFRADKQEFDDYKNSTTNDNAQIINDKKNDLKTDLSEAHTENESKIRQGEKQMEQSEAKHKDSLEKAKQAYEESGVIGTFKKIGKKFRK